MLSVGIFISQYITGVYSIFSALFLSLLTVLFLFISLQEDIKDNFSYTIFILPFMFTLSLILFYPLLPARLLTRIIITGLYAFGLYSIFLTQNIFAVSAIRTINLLRSARIVSFILTIAIIFFSANIIFSSRLPFYISPLIIGFLIFIMNVQSLWTYSLNKEFLHEAVFLSVLIALCLAEIAAVLNIWPINAAIYSIVISGVFYAYSGLTHVWVEKRLFRNVLWEYVWVGLLAILILIIFSKWGI